MSPSLKPRHSPHHARQLSSSFKYFIIRYNSGNSKTRIMKQLGYLLFAFLFFNCQAAAQERHDEHLLDGTSMNYYYQTGSAVHISFEQGVAEWEWIAGPWKGSGGRKEYRSRKIGDKMYLVNWLDKESSSLITLVFNFNQNVMWSSAILNPKTEVEQVLFEGGIIEQLVLKENYNSGYTR